MPTSRPVILLGHGIRAAGAAHLAPRLLDLGVPVLASWQAKDLVDNSHPLFMGCPGIYGNRAANLALHNASEVLAIGNRLAIWNVGYEGIRGDQALTIVSLDDAEAMRYPKTTFVREDCRKFLERAAIAQPDDISDWLAQCAHWEKEHPWVEDGTHDDADGYINSYRFFAELNRHLRDDAVIAIDCGAACSSAFQVMEVKPPQRILSSGGLGEMGCGLPAAIGASFARDRGEVICIVGDGAMMLNLQELQTIVHHNLPVKIIVCRNDGYLMIKHTQRMAKMGMAGVDEKTGVSLPRFQQLAFSFGIPAASVRTWADFVNAVPMWLANKGPALIEYHMSPLQKIAPKLDPIYVNDKATSPRFDQMSPAI